MSSNTADAIIYTPKSMNDAQFSEVARQVISLDGVVRFSRNRHQPNMINIVYQAGKIQSLAILNRISRLGFHASLVGM